MVFPLRDIFFFEQILEAYPSHPMYKIYIFLLDAGYDSDDPLFPTAFGVNRKPTSLAASLELVKTSCEETRKIHSIISLSFRTPCDP